MMTAISLKAFVRGRLPGTFPFFLATLLLATSISFLPQAGGGRFSFHDGQRLAQLVLLLAGLALAAWRLARHPSLLPSPGRTPACLLAAFFVLGLCSSLLAWSVRHALMEWTVFLLLVVLAWVIAGEVRANAKAALDWLLGLCGLGCGLYALASLSVHLAGLVLGIHPAPGDLFPGFDNHRFFNHVQTVTLPLLGLLAVRARQRAGLPAPGWGSRAALAWRYQPAIAGILLAAWWMLLFASSGRGTLVGVGAGIALAWLWRRRHAAQWCLAMAGTGIAGFLAYLALYRILPGLMGRAPFSLLSNTIERTLANPGSGRMALWESAWQMAASEPWLGAGPLHFAHVGRDILAGAHPHNWVLQIAAEWGIPALLCLCAILVLAWRALLRAGKTLSGGDAGNQAVLAAWLGTFAAIAIDGLVSGLIVMPTSQLWIVIFAGYAWGWTMSLSPAAATVPRRASAARRTCLVLCAPAFAALLAWGLWPELSDLRAHERASLSQNKALGMEALFPRIWRAGNF
ncbi:MAG: O-antigen ligase family protein [Noviherbaspirillum sp.]